MCGTASRACSTGLLSEAALVEFSRIAVVEEKGISLAGEEAAAWMADHRRHVSSTDTLRVHADRVQLSDLDISRFYHNSPDVTSAIAVGRHMLIVVLDGNIDVTHGDEYFAASKGEAFVYPKSLSVVMRSAAPFATLELEFGGGVSAGSGTAAESPAGSSGDRNSENSDGICGQRASYGC